MSDAYTPIELDNEQAIRLMALDRAVAYKAAVGPAEIFGRNGILTLADSFSKFIIDGSTI